MVGDVAGYAAATWLRGIPFVQVPTTLLAQVDSSVGGKTGIDHPKGKNLIGAFYQPRLVVIDVDTLSTLVPRQFRAGIAEVIKYGVVIDLPFFEYIESHVDELRALNSDVLEEIILRCCRLKAEVVEQDEKEGGVRAILNYGHTLGHAFEALAGYRDMVHGEAVAVGMALAARISLFQGECSESDRQRICDLIVQCGLSIEIPPFDRQLLINALSTDKKSKSGTITFISNRGIGAYTMTRHTPDELLWMSGVESDDDIIDDLELYEEIEILADDEAEDDLYGHQPFVWQETPVTETELPDSTPGSCLPDPLATATLAELYVSQGFVERALTIYYGLTAANPADETLRGRIAELEGRGNGSVAVASEPHALCDDENAFAEAGAADFPIPSVPRSGRADTAVTVLNGWLENIKRMKAESVR